MVPAQVLSSPCTILALSQRSFLQALQTTISDVAQACSLVLLLLSLGPAYKHLPLAMECSWAVDLFLVSGSVFVACLPLAMSAKWPIPDGEEH
jgi:hypothetical protein